MNDQLALFWDLAVASATTRQESIVKIVEFVAASQQNLEIKSDAENTVLYSEALKYAMKRLIRGLASSRECARQGFSTCLACLMSEVPDLSVDQVIDDLLELTNVTGSMKGQEGRDLLFGRLFGCYAIIYSNRMDDQLCVRVFNMLVDLYQEKQWIAESCADAILKLVSLFPNCMRDPLFAARNKLFGPPKKRTWTASNLMLAIGIERLYNIHKSSPLLEDLLPEDYMSMSTGILCQSFGRNYVISNFFDGENDTYSSDFRLICKTTSTGYPRVHRLWDYLFGSILDVDFVSQRPFSALEQAHPPSAYQIDEVFAKLLGRLMDCAIEELIGTGKTAVGTSQVDKIGLALHLCEKCMLMMPLDFCSRIISASEYRLVHLFEVCNLKRNSLMYKSCKSTMKKLLETAQHRGKGFVLCLSRTLLEGISGVVHDDDDDCTVCKELICCNVSTRIGIDLVTPVIMAMNDEEVIALYMQLEVVALASPTGMETDDDDDNDNTKKKKKKGLEHKNNRRINCLKSLETFIQTIKVSDCISLTCCHYLNRRLMFCLLTTSMFNAPTTDDSKFLPICSIDSYLEPMIKQSKKSNKKKKMMTMNESEAECEYLLPGPIYSITDDDDVVLAECQSIFCSLILSQHEYSSSSCEKDKDENGLGVIQLAIDFLGLIEKLHLPLREPYDLYSKHTDLVKFVHNADFKPGPNHQGITTVCLAVNKFLAQIVLSVHSLSSVFDCDLLLMLCEELHAVVCHLLNHAESCIVNQQSVHDFFTSRSIVVQDDLDYMHLLCCACLSLGQIDSAAGIGRIVRESTKRLWNLVCMSVPLNDSVVCEIVEIVSTELEDGESKGEDGEQHQQSKKVKDDDEVDELNDDDDDDDGSEAADDDDDEVEDIDINQLTTMLAEDGNDGDDDDKSEDEIVLLHNEQADDALANMIDLKNQHLGGRSGHVKLERQHTIKRLRALDLLESMVSRQSKSVCFISTIPKLARCLRRSNSKQASAVLRKSCSAEYVSFADRLNTVLSSKCKFMFDDAESYSLAVESLKLTVVEASKFGSKKLCKVVASLASILIKSCLRYESGDGHESLKGILRESLSEFMNKRTDYDIEFFEGIATRFPIFAASCWFSLLANEHYVNARNDYLKQRALGLMCNMLPKILAEAKGTGEAALPEMKEMMQLAVELCDRMQESLDGKQNKKSKNQDTASFQKEVDKCRKYLDNET